MTKNTEELEEELDNIKEVCEKEHVTTYDDILQALGNLIKLSNTVNKKTQDLKSQLIKK